MGRLKLLWKIIKNTHLDRIIFIFFILFIATALVIWIWDPAVDSFRESLWYCFVSSTTIGFGDVVAESFVGRLMTVFLTICEILIVAFIPAVAVSYYTEITKIQEKESVMAFMDKLENLDQLSKEELAEISKKVKEKRYKV